MPGLRDLKQRIKGIQGMRKVTKAMQMVSAAKMRKAQDAVVSSRTYASLAQELIESVMGQNQSSSGAIPEVLSASAVSTGSRRPEYYRMGEKLSGIQDYGLDAGSGSGMTPLLMSYPNAKKIGVILLSTNRGLVGSLNTNLQPMVRKINQDADVIAELVVYGKKAKAIAGRMQKNIIADFNKEERKITSEDIYPIAQFIIEAYKTGQYKEIVIVYNHFVSTLVQKATVKKLLPFEEARVQVRGDRVETGSDKLSPQPSAISPAGYLFEPTPQAVLDHLLPRIIESQLYEVILESNASEHSARMVMMKNATEAAGDLIDDYKLTYNQLRQGKITTELSEITAGRIALE